MIEPKDDLLVRLVMGTVASCCCMTKTHEVKYHDELCRYRLLTEATDEITKLREGNSNVG